jgi:hypothetical protein
VISGSVDLSQPDLSLADPFFAVEDCKAIRADSKIQKWGKFQPIQALAHNPATASKGLADKGFKGFALG